ncbi:hypothetical protein V500_00959 [Pseudogymnoascus sp. VKM F-4518 (FW-2643)]|nr:hypothetical protein V500_00959 [Pseudogymnoascus sp. VKM F-4518 (FW-2643)]
MPPGVLRNCPSQHRRNHRTEDTRQRRDGDVRPPLRRSNNIPHHAICEGNSGGGPSALDQAEHEEGGVIVLQCETDVRGVEDEVADHVDGAAAGAVSDVGEKGGDQALDYEEEGYG